MDAVTVASRPRHVGQKATLDLNFILTGIPSLIARELPEARCRSTSRAHR